MPSFSIRALADLVSAKIIGDEKRIITALAPLHRAKTGELTYLKDQAHQRYLATTTASAVVLTENNAKNCLTTALIVDNPELAFARIAALFQSTQSEKKLLPGIHPSAVIATTAKIDPSASIGALCVIGEHVVMGANTIIHPGVMIGNDVVMGSHCELYSRVTLYHHVVLGNRVILHSGAVIGSDGFGYAQNKGSWEKMPQLGSVIIGDDVEIGANTCVDRGALDNTVIEKGVKLDNLVQISHNVFVGANTVMAGCSAVAGSTHIGKQCIIGGAVDITGHITICDGAVFTGSAMVTKSIKEPGIYSSGTGILPNAVWRKSVVHFRNQKRGRNNEQ